MEKSEIRKSLNEIFIKTLNNKSIVLNDQTTARDVEEWDSLAHIQLIIAIEKHFKIRFTSLEIQSFKNVGSLCDIILSKLEKK